MSKQAGGGKNVRGKLNKRNLPLTLSTLIHYYGSIQVMGAPVGHVHSVS